MNAIEEKIKNYINSYFTSEEFIRLAKVVDIKLKDDFDFNPLEYQNICNKILKLFNTSLLSKYRIEIGESCSFLIKKLFDTYVDQDTFIVTSNNDHQSVTSLLGNNKRFIITNTDTKTHTNELITSLIDSFKKSSCKKLFCIIAGTAPQTSITISQSFFIELKKQLIKHNISHIMILDNCQGLFVIERNYDIFDGFLGTGHMLSPLFPKVGFLFTKLPQRIGYMNKQTLSDIYSMLEIITNKKQKALQFNELLSDYFGSLLKDTNFSKFDMEAPHQFVISLPGTKNNSKYDNQFMYYGIRFNPIDSQANFVSIRYHEAVIQDADHFLTGLKNLKAHLIKLNRFRELANDINFSQKSRVKNSKFDAIIHINPKIKALLTLDQQKLIYERFLNTGSYQHSR